MIKLLNILITVSFLFSIQWDKEDLLTFDKVENVDGSDITTVFHKKIQDVHLFRVQFLDLKNNSENFQFQYNQSNWLSLNSDEILNIENNLVENRLVFEILDSKILEKFQFKVLKNDIVIDEVVWQSGHRETLGNAAFVHHGNQGLTYSTVFYGEDPQSNSGFDEILEVHQNTNIPGNFHL